MSASTRNAPGLSVSPHSLSRGNRARSNTRTRPARARIGAASDPAGPAPTMTTSSIALARSRGSQVRPRLAPLAGLARCARCRVRPFGRRSANSSIQPPPNGRAPHDERQRASPRTRRRHRTRTMRAARSYTAPSTSAEFFEPNPRQLHSAASGRAARPSLGRKSRSQSGSGSVRLIVGGRNPRESASAVVDDARRAAGALRVADHRLGRRPGQRVGSAPKTRRVHSASMASFNCVEVP